MCKYCEFNDRDDVITISEEGASVIVGDICIGTHILDLSFMKEEGETIMYVGYAMGDFDVVNLKVPIAFCPFCGRALEH